MNEPILQTTNLSIGYKQKRTPTKTVVDKLNLSLRSGELICLLGPNGAGKSTLMRTLSALQPPLSGTITLFDQPLSTYPPQRLAKIVSLVLTDRSQIGILSAYAVVALGRYPYSSWSGKLTELDQEIIHNALTAVGALPLADRFIHELSDGERQKIMIARALAQAPQLMFLDEPTAYLDLPRRIEIMHILRQLAYQENRAILLSTHDLDLAMRYADQLWLLSADGQMHIGAPEDLVLNGSFAKTFENEGVLFDADTGFFKINHPTCLPVNLVGSGQIAFWADRALQRAGFAPVTEPTPFIISFSKEKEQLLWHLTQTNQPRQTFTSLYHLLSHLKQAS